MCKYFNQSILSICLHMLLDRYNLKYGALIVSRSEHLTWSPEEECGSLLKNNSSKHLKINHVICHIVEEWVSVWTDKYTNFGICVSTSLCCKCYLLFYLFFIMCKQVKYAYSSTLGLLSSVSHFSFLKRKPGHGGVLELITGCLWHTLSGCYT